MCLLICSRVLRLATPPRPVVTMSSVASPEHEKRLLRGVLIEALAAQDRKRTALEEQLARMDSNDFIDGDDEKAAKAREKALRRAELVPQRLAEVDAAEARLTELRSCLKQRGADLSQIRSDLAELGLAERLATFDVEAMAQSQWGRPDGFDGLVIESPRGIPIVVARQSFSDELLRRVGRGTDLFFQVCEGRGSRVLLRTSMVRSLVRSPRECMETAADLAAYFSDARRWPDEVEVMYTDSRRVAKRGTRVGQLKRAKRLGVVWAQPGRVAELARDAQEEQGWI
jgi:predicted ribosome quality control (RQC) complex YloA/Tae2 family protein